MKSGKSSPPGTPGSSNLTGGPAGTPITPRTNATPANAMTATAGLTPGTFPGTPLENHPHLRRQGLRDRVRALSSHPRISITAEHVMENLAERYSMETGEQRKNAFEEGSESLDRLRGVGSNELEQYQKLKDDPNKLAEKIAKLVFGSLMDVGKRDEADEKFKAPFELDFLNSDDDKKAVLDQALHHISVLDGKGLAGDENTVVGSASLLDPDNRFRLSFTTQTMLSKLETGRWLPDLPSGTGAKSAFGTTEQSPMVGQGDKPLPQIARSATTAAELSVIPVTNTKAAIQNPEKKKRSADVAQLDAEDASRAAPRRREEKK